MDKADVNLNFNGSGDVSKRLGSSRNFDNKMEFLEEKITETTDIALKAEKAVIDLEKFTKLQFNKSRRLESSPRGADHTSPGDLLELSSLKSKIDSFDRKYTTKFNKIKQYMSESNELLKSHSHILSNLDHTDVKGGDLDYDKVKLMISKSEKRVANSVAKDAFTHQEELREKIEKCVMQVTEFMRK